MFAKQRPIAMSSLALLKKGAVWISSDHSGGSAAAPHSAQVGRCWNQCAAVRAVRCRACVAVRMSPGCCVLSCWFEFLHHLVWACSVSLGRRAGGHFTLHDGGSDVPAAAQAAPGVRAAVGRAAGGRGTYLSYYWRIILVLLYSLFYYIHNSTILLLRFYYIRY